MADSRSTGNPSRMGVVFQGHCYASFAILLGLIRHLTGAEEHWFQRVFPGQDHDIDLSMTVPPAPPATRSSPPAGRRGPAATRSCGLPRSVHRRHHRHPRRTPPVSLRPTATHMIEETARHAGHAGILRSRSTAPPACETIRRRQRGGTRPLTASHTAVSAIRHVTNRVRLMHGVWSERFLRHRWQSRSSRL